MHVVKGGLSVGRDAAVDEGPAIDRFDEEALARLGGAASELAVEAPVGEHFGGVRLNHGDRERLGDAGGLERTELAIADGDEIGLRVGRLSEQLGSPRGCAQVKREDHVGRLLLLGGLLRST
eukprot:scaffold128498_cov27-Tisochrysis_lutea.AAC.3